MVRELDGVRVLVVEGDRECRELFRVILELEGATVTTAATAWAAVKLVGGATPDVIVSELGLPDEDGCWLMRSLRAGVRAGARPPRIVIVTANNEGYVRTRCLRAGCDAFLLKPLDPLELCRVVAGLACGPASRRCRCA